MGYECMIVSVISFLSMAHRKETASLTTIWLAIAFVLACRELSRRSGIAAADWGKELRLRALDKLNRWSDLQLVRFIKENFNFD